MSFAHQVNTPPTCQTGGEASVNLQVSTDVLEGLSLDPGCRVTGGRSSIVLTSGQC